MLKIKRTQPKPQPRAWLVTLPLQFLWLLLLLSATSIQVASSDEIAEQTLQYAAFYGSKKIGKIEIDIRREKDGYIVTSVSKPTLLARMLVGAHTTTTRFVRHQNELTLDSSKHIERQGDDTQSFRIDHSGNLIQFNNGRQVQIREGEKLEAASFPLLLMYRTNQDIPVEEVREVSVKRVRNYRYEKSVLETVQVPAGEFIARKIKRFRVDRPADNVTVWLSHDKTEQMQNWFPVKILIDKRKKANVVLLLKNRR